MPANVIPGTKIFGDASADALRAVAGSAHVRPAGAGDAVAGVQPGIVVEPGSEQELAAVLRYANQAGLSVAPCGGGTKLSWGNPPKRLDLIVSTARLDRVVEHAWADLTVIVEAGCTIQRLQETLAQRRQRLALDPLWPEHATIGGVLSTNDSGALRLRFGGLRDLIIGMTLALPDGTLAVSGGKVVKNVAGYDLPKLATGALGTLGVITRAIFRLHPLPQCTMTLSLSARSLSEAQRFIAAVQDSQLAHSALQIRAGDDLPPEADVLFECVQAGLAAQEMHLRKLAAPNCLARADGAVWKARERLWGSPENATIAKISVLPAEIVRAIEIIELTAPEQAIRWRAVMQATGVGWLRLDGAAEGLHALLLKLRARLERDGGSLQVLRQPAGMPRLDAWGNAGNALPLMVALKKEFDPKDSLNHGRFVGGI
ncbi:MAG: FAD-binding oxidoreductase [Terriglobia bacterium]